MIQEEKLQENSNEVGTYTLQKFAQLRDEFDIVGDIRGKGLMIGMEMVRDKVGADLSLSLCFLGSARVQETTISGKLTAFMLTERAHPDSRTQQRP